MLSAPRNLHLGPGTNLYDFTYAPNVALAHILAAKNLLSIAPAEASNPSSAAGKAFFITNCEPVPFRSFLEMVWAAFPLRKNGEEKQSKGFTLPTRVAVVLIWISQKVAEIARKKPFLTMNGLGDSLSQRWFDNTAAKSVLGYFPTVTLEQGLGEAAASLKLQTGA
jgi:sterol-4alpha-carboxylate 3-dehydrogenase (decarboxylating)